MVFHTGHRRSYIIYHNFIVRSHRTDPFPNLLYQSKGITENGLSEGLVTLGYAFLGSAIEVVMCLPSLESTAR